MFLSLRLPHEVTQMSWIVLVVLKGRETKIWIRMNAIKNPISQQQLFMSALDGHSGKRTREISIFKASSDAPALIPMNIHGKLFLLHNFSLSLRLISLIILFPMPSDTGQGDAEHRGLKSNLEQKKVSKTSSSNHSYNSPVLGRVEIYSNEPRRPITDEKQQRKNYATERSAMC